VVVAIGHGDSDSGAGIDGETARKHIADAKEFVDAAAKFLGEE
jgi:hypothetical protein